MRLRDLANDRRQVGIHPGWFRLYDWWCDGRFEGELDAEAELSRPGRMISYQPIISANDRLMLNERTIYQGPRDQNGAGHAKVGSPFVAQGRTWRVTRIEDGSWFDSRWPGETQMRRLYGVRIS